MKVSNSNVRTPEEEYSYWHHKLHNKIDEKLPWEMHPNEIQASDRYYAKMKRKIREALDLMHKEEHNVYFPPE